MTTKPDVPGTYVFDIADSRHGHAINELCSTLTTPAHRARFLADEADYCDHFDMTPAQRTAVLQRDWRSLLDLGARSSTSSSWRRWTSCRCSTSGASSPA